MVDKAPAGLLTHDIFGRARWNPDNVRLAVVIDISLTDVQAIRHIVELRLGGLSSDAQMVFLVARNQLRRATER